MIVYLAPAWALSVVAGLFGLLFGSFFNVCIHRLPQHRSVVTPRSYCPGCSEPIAWFDNLPLVSYVALLGRCRRCHRTISFRYPLVEIVTGLLYIGVVAQFGPTLLTVKWLTFVSILLILFWTDIEQRLLPDVLTLGGLALGFVFSFLLSGPPGLGDAALGAAVLSLPFFVLLYGYAAARRIDPPGLGDVKLLAAIGAFTGWKEGLAALLIGSVAGSVIGLLFIQGTGKNLAAYKLPLGSFLCAGAAIIVFWGPKLTTWWWNSGI